jgi:hypothetical protein
MPNVSYGKRGDGARVAKSDAVEKKWQAQVLGTARSNRWRAWHFHDARREVTDRRTQQRRIIGDGDAKDFPDLVLVHPRFGIGFVELKTDQTASKATPGQLQALTEIAGAAAAVAMGERLPPGGGRIFVHLWRPRDLATVVLPVLQGRAGPYDEGIPRFYGWDQ